ncbi:MAG: RHS repeat-associated core domain-containing protein, partial [Verrucomicrobiae bacterium]
NLTYDGWNLIEERDGTGALQQVYVHGAAVDEILTKITTTGAVYYHADGLGNTVALTNETGQLVESTTYDAFGAATIRSASGSVLPASSVANRFLFTGREWLSDAGIYDYRNRVYSPALGRFLQTDPIRFAAGDVNIYRYCRNNPVKWVDPMGLDVFRIQEPGIAGHAYVGIGGNAAPGSSTYGGFPSTGNIFDSPMTIQNPNATAFDPSTDTVTRYPTTPEQDAKLKKWVDSHFDINDRNDNKDNPPYIFPFQTCRDFADGVIERLKEIQDQEAREKKKKDRGK